MKLRRQAWLYIMANRPNGTIYVGVTNDLAHRAWEHRTGAAPGFTKRYGLKRLVYAEPHETMPSAIVREKNVKSWPRAWRVRLITTTNPNWDDLYESLLHQRVKWNSWVAKPSLAMTGRCQRVPTRGGKLMDGRAKRDH